MRSRTAKQNKVDMLLRYNPSVDSPGGRWQQLSDYRPPQNRGIYHDESRSHDQIHYGSKDVGHSYHDHDSVGHSYHDYDTVGYSYDGQNQAATGAGDALPPPNGGDGAPPYRAPPAAPAPARAGGRSLERHVKNTELLIRVSAEPTD